MRATLDDSTGFELALAPTRPVLHNGGAGQYDLLGVTTTQYSVGFVKAEGLVRLDGQVLPASGLAWHDRQWDHGPRTGALAFTWLGLCLDSGDTASFFEISSGSWATIARADATHLVTAASAVPADLRPTCLGRLIPRPWTLTIPALSAELEMAERLISDGKAICIGAMEITGRFDGSAAGGYGFCDVVGPLPA